MLLGTITSVVACNSDSFPVAAVDTTLADYTKDGDLELQTDSTGKTTGWVLPWSMLGYDYESTSSCPLLHVRVTVNGDEMQVMQGSGRDGPIPHILMCSPPYFYGTIAGGLTGPVEVRVWDETLTWTMHGDIPVPKASIDGATLRIGTRAHIRLDPIPPAYAQIQFDSDDKHANFTVSAKQDGSLCDAEASVSDANGHLTLDGKIPCDASFEQDGISVLIPDIGDHTGHLEITGWPETNVTSCDGVAYCRLDLSDLGGANEPYVDLPVHIAP